MKFKFTERPPFIKGHRVRSGRRRGEVLASPFEHGGCYWVAVLWDGKKLPSLTRTRGLERA